MLGGAAYGFFGAIFAFDSGPNYLFALGIFSIIFFPVLLITILFSYYAYMGFSSDKIYLKGIFWSYIMLGLLGFPLGTILCLVILYQKFKWD